MVSHFIKRNNSIHTQSFSVRHAQLPHFIKLWHHHQELELVYILKGQGTRFIGDSMEPFGPGDLVLLGDFLPHKWQNRPEYFMEQGLEVEAIIVHFEKTFLSNALEDTIEFNGINNLIKKSERGIQFNGKIKTNAREFLYKIVDTPPGITRMIYLIELLSLLAETNNFQFIASSGYLKSVHEKDLKLRKVNDFVMNHFQNPISLDDVAKEVCMNKSAFCRYFKKATNQSFSKYLNEIRIGYACKLLRSEDSRTIASISFESGFNNLSNFNQKFKAYTGHTPSSYLQKSQ